MSNPAPAPYRPAGTLNVNAALWPYYGPWTVREAAHLLRRAGFGGSPDDVARLAALKPQAAVASFVAFDDVPAQPPDFVAPVIDGVPVPDPAQAGALQERARRDPVAKRAVDDAISKADYQNVVTLQRWWLDRMIASPSPLQEKMTLFWHNTYTSAAQQKGINARELLAQNQLFRTFALGNARELALRVTTDAAMVKYLDNAQNRKAHPNENYARELMELFTLGIGNYTEADVREGARALTGWSVRPPAQGGAVVFNRAQHDDGIKTFLGSTGAWNEADVVRIIFERPAAATYLANRLLEHFVYLDPEPELVAAVADLIRRNDFRLRPVVATLLASTVFFSSRAYRALVKTPVEYVVGSYRLFGIANADLNAVNATTAMGQRLFYPPTVKGWTGGPAWLNSQSILARENFANALTGNKAMMRAPWLGETMREFDPPAVARTLAQAVLQGDASPASVSRLIAFLASGGGGQTALTALSIENAEERVRGAAYLAMAMPAYQLS